MGILEAIQKSGDKYMILVNVEYSDERAGFAIAHELGHYFLHMRGETKDIVISFRRDNSPREIALTSVRRSSAMNNQTKRDGLKNDVPKESTDFLHKQREYDRDGILYLCFTKTASAFMSEYPISDANINVMTDQGLLVRADELTESYREKQSFPRIRIVYAALFHESSLNQTLLQLEKRLIKLLSGNTASDNKTELFKTRSHKR